MKTHRAPAPTGPSIDACGLARRVLTGLPNYRLSTVTRHFELPAETYHRATDDAEYCGQIFYRLVWQLEAGGHPVGVHDLIELSGSPPLLFPQFKPASGEQLGLF